MTFLADISDKSQKLMSKLLTSQ